MKQRQNLRAIALAALLAVGVTSAQAAGTANSSQTPPQAQAAGPAYGSGWGAGNGRGAPDGYGPGYGRANGWGMGPWMMGGWGGGYGRGYRWGMGPAMMGAFGGYGMGSWMIGPGYGRWGGGYGVPLSDAQIKKIDAIEKAQFDKQWPLMRAMQQTMLGAWSEASGTQLNVEAVMKQAATLSNLRLQMLRNRLEAQRQIDGVLTKEQRENLGQTP